MLHTRGTRGLRDGDKLAYVMLEVRVIRQARFGEQCFDFHPKFCELLRGGAEFSCLVRLTCNAVVIEVPENSIRIFSWLRTHVYQGNGDW